MEKTLIIIPTYNEKENIEAIINAVFELNRGYHILIVEDNSPDGTALIVKEMMKVHKESLFILERTGKHGLGTAYIAGFLWAIENNYDYIFEMDADFSHNPYDLPLLHQACIDGADVSIGSRYVTGVNVVNWPMKRILMSYFASKYVRFITRMKFRDATAGFVCYRKKVLETIELNKIKFKGYAFQIEMKFKAWKHGFKIVEIPIIFTERREGASKMSKGIFGEAVFGVIKLTVGSWFKKYKKVNK